MNGRFDRLTFARLADPSAAAPFYASVGYGCAVGADDRVLVALDSGRVVGAVRLCREQGVLVLRGMYVDEVLRGGGVGARLLRFAADEIGSVECWCLPYSHLVEFYGRVGFRVCSGEDAPDFLVERCAHHVVAGHDVVVMRRRRR